MNGPGNREVRSEVIYDWKAVVEMSDNTRNTVHFSKKKDLLNDSRSMAELAGT